MDPIKMIRPANTTVLTGAGVGRLDYCSCCRAYAVLAGWLFL